jgi:hypothetical protein
MFLKKTSVYPSGALYGVSLCGKTKITMAPSSFGSIDLKIELDFNGKRFLNMTFSSAFKMIFYMKLPP